jgi:hypothetical protein
VSDNPLIVQDYCMVRWFPCETSGAPLLFA